MHTLITVHDDGSADLTVADSEWSHQFSASKRGVEALVQFEETQAEHGMIYTMPPREEVWKEVMQSDELTEYMEDHGLEKTTRQVF